MAPLLPLHRSSTADIDAAARHPVEAADSWAAYMKSAPADDTDASATQRRQLRHTHRHHHHSNNDDGFDATSYEEIKFQQDIKTEAKQQHLADKKLRKAAKKRQRRYQELYSNSGIESQSVHGLMIDAGSTGSRMHVYEFEPRVLMDKH
jgi:hypothetical protein